MSASTAWLPPGPPERVTVVPRYPPVVGMNLMFGLPRNLEDGGAEWMALINTPAFTCDLGTLSDAAYDAASIQGKDDITGKRQAVNSLVVSLGQVLWVIGSSDITEPNWADRCSVNDQLVKELWEKATAERVIKLFEAIDDEGAEDWLLSSQGAMDVASQAGHLFPVGPRHASTQDRLSFEAFCAVPYLKWHLDQIVHSGAAMIRNGLVDERQTLTVNSTAVRDFLGRPMVKAGCWTREDLRGPASNPMTYQGGEDKKLFLPLTVTLVTAAESVAAAPGTLALSDDTIGPFFDVKPMDLRATGEGVSKDKHGYVSDNNKSDNDITSAQ